MGMENAGHADGIAQFGIIGGEGFESIRSALKGASYRLIEGVRRRIPEAGPVK